MFTRPQLATLEKRLGAASQYIQVLLGPRQVGKSTISNQLAKKVTYPVHMVSGDEVFDVTRSWIFQQWTIARNLASSHGEVLLIIDEIQKVRDWSAVVKELFDEDRKNQTPVKVMLLGSSTLMLQSGLSESLAGRFEILPMPHWNFKECNEAFGLSVEDYVFYGGYPGAIPLKDDWSRFKSYIRDSLIETVIAKDILMMATIKKPALLRRVFDIGCRYASQILSYQKMVGQLNEAGNITTLEHYLKLLGQAGLLTGIDKFAMETVRQRASSPKLMPLNTALMAACYGMPFEAVRNDHELWGRFVETAVGAHLLNCGKSNDVEVFYWKEGNYEVDFVLRKHGKLIPIEVKSTHKTARLNGLDKFAAKFKCHQMLLIGGQGLSLEAFLSKDSDDWFK